MISSDNKINPQKLICMILNNEFIINNLMINFLKLSRDAVKFAKILLAVIIIKFIQYRCNPEADLYMFEKVLCRHVTLHIE